MDESGDDSKTELEERPPLVRQLGRLLILSAGWQVGNNLLWAYTGSLATDLGATGTEQAAVTGVQTLGTAALQGVWGRLSDKLGRRPLLFLGFLSVGITAAIMPLVQSPTMLILLLLLPSLVGSAVIPAWNGMLGDVTTQRERGSFTGLVMAVGTVASVTALVTFGFLSVTTGLTGLAQYQIPLYAASAALFASTLAILVTRETLHPSSRTPGGFLDVFWASPPFRRFLLVNGVFSMAMGMAWPLFPVVTRSIVGADLFQIALLTAVFSVLAGVAQVKGGHIADRAGRKPVLAISRLLIFLCPLLHALGGITLNIWLLLASNIAGGTLTGLYIVSSTAWLLDVAPSESRGSLIALSNIVTGVTSFTGAVISGLITDILAVQLGFHSAVILMLLAIALIRLTCSTGFFTLHETLPKKG